MKRLLHFDIFVNLEALRPDVYDPELRQIRPGIIEHLHKEGMDKCVYIDTKISDSCIKKTVDSFGLPFTLST